MNVLVDMFIFRPRPKRARWVSISGVDVGCFSTSYRDCEALIEREDQLEFTLFVVYIGSIIQNHGIIYKVYYRVWQDMGLARQWTLNAHTTDAECIYNGY